MKGKRIAEVGDLVLLQSDTNSWAQYIGLKNRTGYEFAHGFSSKLSNCYEVAILEKNFQETAPEEMGEAKTGWPYLSASHAINLSLPTDTEIREHDLKIRKEQSEIFPGPVRLTTQHDNSMNWKEWCLWGFIIICAIIAFYRWGYVK